MFGKLMKNEFRNIGKLLILINAIILGMHLLIILFEQIDSSGALRGTVFEQILTVFGGIYVISIFAINVIIVLMFAVRFYKKVYSVEGYLTHTLPVNKTSIYFSILLSSSIGTIITALVSSGYIFVRVASEFDGAVSLTKIFQAAANYNITGITYLLIVLGAVIGVLAYFAFIFLCVSIGQEWKAHPVLGSIIAYWAITTIMQVLSAIWIVAIINLESPASLFSSRQLPGDVINMLAGWVIGLELISLAVMSIINIIIMKKRINL